MVFAEATLAMPLIAGYGYHKKNWEKRSGKEFKKLFAVETATV